METFIRSTVWVVVSTLTLAVPLLMVSASLPKREGFKQRITLSFLALAAFQLLYVPDGPFSTIESLSSQMLVSGLLFFSANVLLMGGIVLFCHQTGLAGAAFCAVVGYTVENLASAVGNIAGIILRAAFPSPSTNISTFTAMSVRMLIAAAIVYAVFYALFVRKIRNHGIDISPGKHIYLFLVAVILFNVAFDIASKRLASFGVPLNYVLLARAAVVALCLYTLLLEYEMLFNRHMQAEAAATARLMEDRREQYELSRETIDAINIKCHDIRHQIRHLEDGTEGARVVDRAILADIAREVNVYDSTVHTGNEVLDTVLTEKALLGGRQSIKLSCIANGEALGFMVPAEIYSLFGNAIENAFEAVRLIDNPEKRVVSLMVKRIAGMVSIHIENPYQGTVSFNGDTPVSSKGDDLNHGFGFKSMRLIVERYGGTLTADADNGMFKLNALIPEP
ncbi:MAG: ATP-binding protein [Atopobiaceae bacterium]|nr:ATP-binding protein [Atopobiaceae bacterium]